MRPLDNHCLFDTSDVEAAWRWIRQSHSDHHLTLLSNNELHAHYNSAKLGNISINCLEYGTDVSIEPIDDDNFFMIQLPLSGQATVKTANNEALTEPGIASVLSPNQNKVMFWSADCRQILVKIDRSKLERKLSEIIKSPVKEPVLFDLAMPYQEGRMASWWRFISYLINELEQPDSIFDTKHLQDNIESTIIEGLLYNHHHNYSEAVNSSGLSIASFHVKRAEEFMHDNISSKITIADLCHAAEISDRTLHAAFKRFRNISPLNYLQNIRLEKVHHELCGNLTAASITDIASKWGFTHMGRFASAYKKRYGETPSSTRRSHLC